MPSLERRIELLESGASKVGGMQLVAIEPDQVLVINGERFQRLDAESDDAYAARLNEIAQKRARDGVWSVTLVLSPSDAKL